MRELHLHTVCEEARCPNIGECWHHGTATFMILGDVCTRACAYCAVAHGKPLALDPLEPERVGTAVEALGLSYVVITSVDRDDLGDGGASAFAETVRQTRRRVPTCRIEVLIPDFKGDLAALHAVLDARPDVLNHNTETVPRLYRMARSGGRYARTLELLDRSRAYAPDIPTKTGVMVGLGEEWDELVATFTDLRQVGVQHPHDRTVPAPVGRTRADEPLLPSRRIPRAESRGTRAGVRSRRVRTTRQKLVPRARTGRRVRSQNPTVVLNAVDVACQRPETESSAARDVPGSASIASGLRARRRPPTAMTPTGAGPCQGSGIPGRGCSSSRLAPAAHGANRTGRMFTGDGRGGSGDFLMAALHRCGYASLPTSSHQDDGLRLDDVYVVAAARCAPPDNKPLPEELAACLSHLRSRNRRTAACAGRGGARSNCVRDLLEARGPREMGEAVTRGHAATTQAGVCPRTTLRARRRAHADRVLPPQPAEHEHGEADRSDARRDLQAGPARYLALSLKPVADPSLPLFVRLDGDGIQEGHHASSSAPTRSIS